MAAAVGIAMLTLRPQQMGGSETYARSLVAALDEVGTLDYVAALPSDAVSGSRGSAPRQLARAARARRALDGVDAVHYPLTIPLPRVRVPRALTLHDVLHRDYPGLVPRSVRLFRAVAYDAAARRARRVIVPSDFVAGRAVSALGLDHGRIRVVPHGVDHDVFRPGTAARSPFLLYPARLWPHKNHERLFQAFAMLRRDDPSLELVLTGAEVAHAVPDGVRALGHVPVAELAALYRDAAALVFPSLYEGFGVPVLEAMASGCPVAASNLGAIREVAGDAAVLFDPLDPTAIANAAREAIAASDDLARRGIEHSRRFTWVASARGHEEVYRELLA